MIATLEEIIWEYHNEQNKSIQLVSYTCCDDIDGSDDALVYMCAYIASSLSELRAITL